MDLLRNGKANRKARASPDRESEERWSLARSCRHALGGGAPRTRAQAEAFAAGGRVVSRRRQADRGQSCSAGRTHGDRGRAVARCPPRSRPTARSWRARSTWGYPSRRATLASSTMRRRSGSTSWRSEARAGAPIFIRADRVQWRVQPSRWPQKTSLFVHVPALLSRWSEVRVLSGAPSENEIAAENKACHRFCGLERDARIVPRPSRKAVTVRHAVNSGSGFRIARAAHSVRWVHLRVRAP